MIVRKKIDHQMAKANKDQNPKAFLNQKNKYRTKKAFRMRNRYKNLVKEKRGKLLKKDKSI
jgi:hypothetical protein